MVDKKRILKELENDFLDIKKEFSLSFSLEEFDSEFNFKNNILEKGFIPCNLVRVMASVIVQSYRDWHGYFNNLLIPNSSSYPSQTESKLFSSEEDKKMLWDLIKKTMNFSSSGSLIFLNNDSMVLPKFLDEIFMDWKNDFKPKLLNIMTRVNSAWKGE